MSYKCPIHVLPRVEVWLPGGSSSGYAFGMLLDKACQKS